MDFQTPDYTVHDDNKLNILICQIKIWNPLQFKDNKPNDDHADYVPKQNEKGCITLHEVGSIEVQQSYKDVITSAVVQFPRGTMIRKFETSFVADPKTEASDKDIAQPNSKDESKDSTKSSASGEVQPIIATISNIDVGVVKIQRSTADKELETADLKVGYRIQIKVGYTDDANYANGTFLSEDNPVGKYDGSSDEKTNNKFILLFTGYITKISANTPIELECEDMLSSLKKKGVPKLSFKNAKVNDMLLPGKSSYLLKDCPIKIHPNVEKQNIELGQVAMTKDLVVADVLTEWSKSGVFCFMRREGPLSEPMLLVGRAYISDTEENQTNNIASMIYRQPGVQPTKIQMDWDVASDNLNIMNVDPKFIAVRASCRNSNNGTINLTVIPDEEDERKYRVVNFTETHKKQVKTAGGNKNKNKNHTKKTIVQTRVDLSSYTVIPFISTEKLTKDELGKKAWVFYNVKKYKTSGIDGSLTVFGDLDIQPTDIISLVDMRQPVRNGFYMVGDVKTSFGTNGYRKEITLPHKIASFKDQIIGVTTETSKKK